MTMNVVLQVAGLDTLLERWRIMLTGAGETLLNLLAALIVGLAIWGIARLAGWLTLRLLRALHFNEAVRRLRVESDRPSRFEPAALAAWGVHWGLVLLGVMTVADVMGFDLTSSVVARLRETLPSVLAATIELLVGIAGAMLLGAIARRLFETAGFRGSQLRGQIVTAVISAFAVLLALEQLGLAAQFIMALGITAVAAAGLAIALAFGLGCRDLARDFIVEYLRSLVEEPAGRSR